MKKESWYVLGCYVLWGLLPIFWKLITGAGALYILAQRIVWSLVFCGALLILGGHWDRVRAVMKDRRQCRLLLASGIMVTCNWGLYILAVTSGRILEASLAYYMNPIMSILIGYIWYREKLTSMQWAAVAAAFVGVMISVIWYGQVPYLALATGGSFAVYGAIKKKVTVDGGTSTFMETMFMSPAALLFIIWSELAGAGCIGTYGPGQWCLFPLAGVVTAVPLILFGKGIQKTPLSLSGILMYVNPTLQLLVGVVLFHEKFTVTSAVTFIFVWIAIILFVGDSFRKKTV